MKPKILPTNTTIQTPPQGRVNGYHTNQLLWSVFLLLLWPCQPSQGVERTEEPSETMVRTIAHSLRCAVCQNQSIYESNSDLAKDMLVIIREKVLAGESEENIRHYFFQRYGDYIYLEPTQEGANRVLWLAPFLGLLLGGGALWTAIRRWKKAENVLPEPNKNDIQIQQAAQQRIQKELERVQL